MGRNWLDVATEGQLLDELAQRRQRLALARGSVTASHAALANSYADAYPWMDPTAVQSLVQAGVSPDLPAVQSIAGTAAQQAAEDGELDTQADDVPDSWFDSLVDTIGGFVKPAVRTGFTALSAPIEELQALLSAAGTALFDETEGAEGFDIEAIRSGASLLLGIPTGQFGEAVIEETSHPGQLVSDFWTNYTTKAARSGGVLALGDLIQGKSVDLGEGFLPGSYSQQTREQPGFTGGIYGERERAKYRLQLDGEFVTPGRIIARMFTPPGSTAYQVQSGAVDFATQVLDPSAQALGMLSRGAQRVRTFQATGLLEGTRKTVALPEAVDYYLTSPLGRRTVSWFARNTNVEDAWRATGYADIHLAEELVGMTDEADVFARLQNVLGTVVRERPNPSFVSRQLGGATEYGRLFGGGAQVRRSLRNARLGIDMPGGVLHVDDINSATRQLNLWMKNAKFDEADRLEVLGRLARVEDGDRIGLWNAVFGSDDAPGVMSQTKELLIDRWGIRESDAQNLTRAYARMADDQHVFGLTAMGDAQDVYAPFKVALGDTTVDAPKASPLLYGELADTIPLPPTVRDIRRATPSVLGFDPKAAQKVYNSTLWKGSIDLMDAGMSKVWKPFQLLRGAYTFRVIAEEQMRMAGAGYDSMLNHPLKAVAWSLSLDPTSRLGRTMEKLINLPIIGTGGQIGTTTITGELWNDIAEHAAAMSRGSAGWRGLPGEILTNKWVKAARSEGGPQFYNGWFTELQHSANDPIMRRLAGGLSEDDLRHIGGGTGSVVDDVKAWFWQSPTGQKLRNSYARIEGRELLAANRQVADDYIDLFVDRLRNSTGGHTDLMEAVARRRLGDVSLRDFGHQGKGARLLEDSYAEAAPAFVKTAETIRARGASSTWDRVVELGFNNLMSRETNWLSRSPTFKQKYYQRISETIGAADRPTQEAMIRAAGEAGLPKDYLTELAAKVVKGEGTQITSLAEADVLAKAFALDETRKLLYDLNKRNQFFDMTRIIFPFGEAWKEIITAWTDILRKNPAAIRRFQQGIEGARAPSVLGEAETEGPGSGEGFFHTDPVTGEEVFTYPAGWVGGLLGVNQASGAGVEFTGRVAGLNLVAATVLPGFGPAVQWPASALIPHTPKYDDLRNLVLPFGGTEGSVPEQVAQLVLPSWLEKVLTALTADPEQHRLFGNTVATTQRALMATGRYDLSTIAGQQELADDARTKARQLYLVRGLAQGFVPTGPSFTWTTEDVEGNVVPYKLLSDDLRSLTEKYDGDRQAAFTEWVRKYGPDNVLATVNMSTSLVDRPVTEKGDAWLRAHPELERDYQLSIGFFAPEPAVGEFDYNAYLRAFETGAREQVTPTEQIALANDFLGRAQWEQAKKIADLRPSPETSVWLAQVREKIAEEHPGFDGWVSRAIWEKRPKPDELIAEVTRAVQDPTLASTDAGKGAIKYLSAIAIAEQMVTRLPNNTRHYQQAKSARPIRDWLRLVAKQIISEHPDFARMWTMVFERELAADDDIPLVAA